jgi:hypothetical protein
MDRVQCSALVKEEGKGGSRREEGRLMIHENYLK